MLYTQLLDESTNPMQDRLIWTANKLMQHKWKRETLIFILVASITENPIDSLLK